MKAWEVDNQILSDLQQPSKLCSEIGHLQWQKTANKELQNFELLFFQIFLILTKTVVEKSYMTTFSQVFKQGEN